MQSASLRAVQPPSCDVRLIGAPPLAQRQIGRTIEPEATLRARQESIPLCAYRNKEQFQCLVRHARFGNFLPSPKPAMRQAVCSYRLDWIWLRTTG